MPFDLVDDALSGMFVDVTRRRYAAGAYTAGVYVRGAETTATIRASVQALKPEEVQDLPEAQRTRRPMRVFSRSELRCVVEGTNTPTDADRIDWEGERFEVVSVKRWNLGTLNHYEAIVLREERE